MSTSKLSPRQRMINMMYLVLIAMLALNVSREILKSFYLFELSFSNANSTADTRNMETMKAFQKKMDDDKTRKKTEKWFLLAKDAHKISREFNAYVEKMKADIIKDGGGRVELKENEKGLTELATPDNMEKHAYYFIDKGLGNGLKLKNRINETREKLLALLSSARNGEAIMASLERSSQLRAEDPFNGTLENKTWVSSYLENAPLAGVVTLLTKTQNDCKTLEADVLNVLSENINIATVIHDGQVALIIPESRYVMSGSSFKAKIALATFDKTSTPKIIVNGNAINVKDGFGEYSFPANGISSHKVEAKIETIDPYTGKPMFLEAEPLEWNSFQPSATISADAMNVLFIGLDNPMSISVPGITPENTFVSANNGVVLTNAGSGKYIARASGTTGTCVVTVSARTLDGSIKKMGESTYRVRKVPYGKLKAGNLSSGTYSKARLMMQQSINVVLEDFYFNNVRFTVLEYSAIMINRKGEFYREDSKNNSPAALKKVLEKARSGETVYIDYVKARGPSGDIYPDPISLKIQ